MIIPTHESFIIGTGVISIMLSLTLALLLATRRTQQKDSAGAQCLRFTLRCGNETRLIRHLRETPREEWLQVTQGFGVSLDWCGRLRLGDNAHVLLNEQHYQSIGLLIAMALVAQTTTPYSLHKQVRIGAQYSKALRQAGVGEHGLVAIEVALRTFLPTWQISIVGIPPPS